MEFDTETVVIGAGVVGLACAASLADSGREVLLLERNSAIGEETSARNSEVIHAGIYYPPGSLKARLCVAGKERLYAYCDARGVPVNRTGKLIVAARAGDRDTLQSLAARGYANGVHDLRLLARDEARGLEPALECHSALLSPSTGIVDTHQLMLSLTGEFEGLGGLLARMSHVIDLQAVEGSFRLLVEADGEVASIHSREVVNCAGHDAVRLAASMNPPACQDLPEASFSRGNYFRISGRAPFSHLIYPVPEPGGLGIHLTLDLAGNARFGPDVEPVAGPEAGYAVDPARAAAFYASIREYWPGLPDAALLPDYAGIRPRIRRPGQDPPDFELLGAAHHGVTGLVHCLGIESPGLTSSLAIGDEVLRRLDGSA